MNPLQTAKPAGRRALLAAASLALCAGGLATTIQGARVPVEAEVAQMALNRDFDRALAEAFGVAASVAVSARASAPAKPDGRARTAAPALRREPAPVPTAIAPGQPLARITVERLGVRHVILAGPATHEALAKAPMMVRRGDAASPVTVLAAHRDTHFLFVRDLREGDLVTLQYVTGAMERYRVTHFATLRWDEFTYPADPPHALLALATCYPFGGTEYGGPWRRVAWAERLS